MKRDLKKGMWVRQCARQDAAGELGDNDWPAVMKVVDEIGYRGWANAEPAWQPPGVDPAVRLKQISEKMDRILAS